MAKKEAQTDLWVYDLLKSAHIELCYQSSDISEIEKALKTASKSGSGKVGKPEFAGVVKDFVLVIEDKTNIAEEIREYMNHFSRKNNSIRTFFFNLFDIKDFIKVKPSLFDISYFYVPSPLNITQYTLGLDGLSGIGIAELRFFEYETIDEYNKKQSS